MLSHSLMLCFAVLQENGIYIYIFLRIRLDISNTCKYVALPMNDEIEGDSAMVDTHSLFPHATGETFVTAPRIHNSNEMRQGNTITNTIVKSPGESSPTNYS